MSPLTCGFVAPGGNVTYNITAGARTVVSRAQNAKQTSDTGLPAVQAPTQ
jgi:hypothetical protein